MPTLTKVYETTDHKLFRERDAAKRHEAWLELVELCDHSMKDPEISPRVMASYLVEHSNFVQRLLRADPAEGGGEDERASWPSELGGKQQP